MILLALQLATPGAMITLTDGLTDQQLSVARSRVVVRRDACHGWTAEKATI